MQEKYGGRVDLEYIDINDDPRLDDYPEVKKYLDDYKTPLPIIAFDSEPVMAGALSYPYLVAELTKRGIRPEGENGQ